MTDIHKTTSYIVLTRNPTSRQLFAIVDGDGELEEFGSYEDALAATDRTTATRAWGYEIVEVPL